MNACKKKKKIKQNCKLFGNAFMLTSDNLAINFSTIKYWLWNEINILNIYVNVNLCSFMSFCFVEGLFWLSFWFSRVCWVVIVCMICRLCLHRVGWLVEHQMCVWLKCVIYCCGVCNHWSLAALGAGWGLDCLDQRRKSPTYSHL